MKAIQLTISQFCVRPQSQESVVGRGRGEERVLLGDHARLLVVGGARLAQHQAARAVGAAVRRCGAVQRFCSCDNRSLRATHSDAFIHRYSLRRFDQDEMQIKNWTPL